jgi:hypothetical protein
VRFEHHLDNLATIDHVLGTIGFVLGFIAIFGTMGVGWPIFILFFVGGWYLRQTADELRKYRPAARTAQAVIAILVATTGILIPFSISSFWVLFSHRGRTYYEARARGAVRLAAGAAASSCAAPLGDPRPVHGHFGGPGGTEAAASVAPRVRGLLDPRPHVRRARADGRRPRV